LVYENEKRNEDYVLNPFDLYTLKQLVEIKKISNINITCICMGVPKSEEVLRRCLAIGADKAVLVSDSKFGGADTIATVKVLGEVVKKIGTFNYLVCGKKTVDGETGQVPYGLAEYLKLKVVDNVVTINKVSEDELLLSMRKNNKLYEAKAFNKSMIIMNEYALKDLEVSLLALKRARKKEIEVLHFSDLDLNEEDCGIKGSKTYVIDAKNTTVSKKDSEVVEGSQEDKAKFIFEMLKSRRNI